MAILPILCSVRPLLRRPTLAVEPLRKAISKAESTRRQSFFLSRADGPVRVTRIGRKYICREGAQEGMEYLGGKIDDGWDVRILGRKGDVEAKNGWGVWT